jgi:solute carrier family 25 phosphate transporter 23/24/25/41
MSPAEVSGPRVSQPQPQYDDQYEDDEYFEEEEDDGHHDWLEGHTALKFLSAGGIAGAGECYAIAYFISKTCFPSVSRTFTAPFDRLKIFLITRPPDLGGASLASRPSIGGIKVIGGAVARIYTEGGILAFWTGNGLSVAKIFPESAIKFYSYESSVS